VTEVRLRIDDVLFGSAPDSSIELTLLETGFGLTPGDRILTWSHYTPEDDWRLRGWCLRLDGDVLRDRLDEPAWVASGGPQRTLSLSAVRHDLSDRNHPSSLFNGIRSIALARLRGSSRWSESGATYEVDSLAWALGKGEVVPRVLTFPAAPGCHPEIFPGDSLLVPIPPGYQGDTLSLPACPSALRVKDGFVPGLGVPLSEILRSIDMSGPMLRLRRYQRRT
jgi:hypothetical protein